MSQTDYDAAMTALEHWKDKALAGSVERALAAVTRFHAFASEVKGFVVSRDLSQKASLFDIGSIGILAVENVLTAERKSLFRIMMSGLSGGLAFAASRQYIYGSTAVLDALYRTNSAALYDDLWALATEIRGPLEVVQKATHDAAEVVRRVLGFTAMRPVSRAARVDLNAVVGEVIELTRPRWQDQAHLQAIAIDVVSRLGEIPRVAGEDASLREVVMNLLLNAVDALPRGGTITITTGVADGWVACSVADDGVGMSGEVRHRALEPFFTTKGPHNTGLGLSVAHGIVKRHRGELEIRSAPDKGTVVALRLGHLPPPIVHLREERVLPRLARGLLLELPARPPLQEQPGEILVALGGIRHGVFLQLGAVSQIAR